VAELSRQEDKVKQQLLAAGKELDELKNQDQYKINKTLEEEIKNIQDTYNHSVKTYEDLLDLKSSKKDTQKLDELFADLLSYLAQRNYASGSAVLADLNKQIKEENDKLAAAFSIPVNVVSNNTPPASGYQRQKVDTSFGSFLIDIISADLNNTRVIVDTASDGTCANDCPVLALADYVARSGAFAGVNGSYFCPAAYPSCAGRTNSFDTLLMNKNKVYFNSENNVYSTVPAAIFSGNSARFVGRSLEWGRDTGVDAVIANQPLLVMNGESMFGGDDDAKKSGKGSRSFVGVSGSTVYIGVAHNVSVAEMAQVLKTMGIQNALNLDSGGSTALWLGGYKVGPGRNIPNALLFVRR
jgi:exopolysaccharide biosynthesis protein